MNVLNVIKSATGPIGTAAEKHSPEICLGLGIVGMVAGTVMACKGTMKAKKAIEDAKDDFETISKSEELGHTYDEENNEIEYTHKDSLNDKAIVCTKTGMALIKAYGPAVILTAAGIACLVSGHNILRKRNIALVAAYKSIDQAYKKYQDKVKEALGETLARDLKYGLKEEETVVDTGKKNKDGTPKTKKEKKTIMEDKNAVKIMSPYARFFDEGCHGWENDPIYNLAYLRNKQSWCNDRLRIEKVLCLNDVYEELGMKKTRKGQVVGWIYDPEVENKIDFGIYDMAYTPNRDFVDGYEPVCLLDFNVDGPVINNYPDLEEEI